MNDDDKLKLFEFDKEYERLSSSIDTRDPGWKNDQEKNKDCWRDIFSIYFVVWGFVGLGQFIINMYKNEYMLVYYFVGVMIVCIIAIILLNIGRGKGTQKAIN